MLLVSTRNSEKKIPALQAVLKGISDDGGLFIPSEFPKLNEADLDSLRNLSYQKLSAKILNMFFDEIRLDDMEKITEQAYSTFDVKNIVPLKKLSEREYILELWHGPTLAFKDVALQILPRLMAKALEQKGIDEDVLILTATSGDTGKAALEGFQDVDRVKIVVFYPDAGVSDMQKMQMVTQEGKNTAVIAVKGNFDDTQNGVKGIFTDKNMAKNIKEKGYVLSSANSINIGRLTPQIVYYFWSYICLLNNKEINMGDKINVVVPTGNFGNILAAYYAHKMGLPVNKFICASNTNRVLTDFFKNKEYRLKNRNFVKTMSPSMDILISSNLERLVADMIKDSDIVNALFNDLKEKGKYDIKKHIDNKKTQIFYANWACEKRTQNAIKDTFDEYNYLIDPHTAVGKRVCDDYYMETNDKTKCVIASTANPYKFSSSVLEAFGENSKGDAFETVDKLAKLTNTKIPKKISELKNKKVLHKSVINKSDMFSSIMDAIK
mgnify:CR=1 FL=1|jgi:threonine synthase